MYAILDIETTGGQFNEEGITEIAIYKHDGTQIVDQFISLVNPEKPIQPFVVKLTGINNAMLRSAPKFHEVAKRIIEITQDCILVAHNAEFDYRILRTEFRRLGYPYEAKTICTVELSKLLLPDQLSYSLGKLVRALGIPMADRHRASGDALATTKLFQLLLDKDVEKTIVKEVVKSIVEKGMSANLAILLDQIPSQTGVYYMHRKDGSILYIGKSKNIKKRVNQHFTGITNKSKKIQLEVAEVRYEETGSELIALLKESDEIKVHKPIHNRSQRKSLFQWALYPAQNPDGYLRLMLQKTDYRKKEITSFTTIQDAKNALFRITSHYKLCQKYTGLYETKAHCFQYTISECDGACIGKVAPETYNARVENFIAKNNFHSKTFAIVDRGRKTGERSVVLLENGIYKGYAFVDLNYQITNLDILKTLLIPMQNNRDTQTIIQGHLRRNPNMKIISYSWTTWLLLLDLLPLAKPHTA